MNKVSFLNKNIQPSKVVCIGRNYVEHIQELGNETPDEMVVFIKPNSAISNTLKSDGVRIHYETELCLLIESDRFKAVGVGFDLTDRDKQSQLKSKGLPWERAKAFDGSAVFSDFVELPDKLEGLRFTLKINNQLIQQGDFKLMMHKPGEILNEVTSFMSFSDGDIVMTGTPKGVGVLNQGDHFCAEVLDNDECLVKQEWLVQ